MRHYLSVLLSFVLMFSLAACGNNTKNTYPEEYTPPFNSAVSETNEASRIKVKGTFLLDPSEDLDLSEEGLAPVQQYLFLVYDVTSSSNNENEVLSSQDDSITITMNDTNSYDQLDTYDGKVLRTFFENCGYAVSTSYGTLWGGSEPVRMIAAFALNGNDIKDGCTAKVKFQLSENLEASIDIAGEDIQTINWMDGVFAVEENADAYQIAQSVRVRTQVCKISLEQASQANRDRDINLRTLSLALCNSMFSEDAVWGISCASIAGNVYLSEDIPRFNLENVRLYYPEIGSKIETVASCITVMNEELEQDKPDYDNVNSAQRLAYNTLNELLDFFGIK